MPRPAPRPALLPVPAVPVCALLAAACSASPGTTPGDASGGGGGGTASASNAGGASGTGVGGGLLPTGGSGGACPGELACSGNLREVLCDGEIVAYCGSGEVCSNGACEKADPCEVAAENRSSVGCDFLVANPDVPLSAGACFAAFVANTWTTPIAISVERDGVSLDASSFARIPSGSGKDLAYAPLPGGELPPGDIAILFLAQHGPEKEFSPACPPGIEPAFSLEDAAPHATRVGRAFRVRTSAPVVAYDVFPFGGGRSATASATLLLPVSAWDTNYVAVTARASSTPTTNQYPWLQILAAEDGTEVTVLPTAAIVQGEGVPAAGAGVPKTYALQAGEILHVVQAADLTGSPIQANKPVGLVGGARCLRLPGDGVACDAAHQMIPPLRALGREYVAAGHRDRFEGQAESPPYLMVGAVDGTELSYDPAPPPGAPLSLVSGEIHAFRAEAPFVVRSQDGDHPFYLAAQMTSASEVSPPEDGRGDPETVNLVPTDQFLTSYVFFADPTYPETSLAVVRRRGARGFEEVTLDCAGAIGPWTPVGKGGEFELARVDLVRGDFEPQGECGSGRHAAKSAAPFSITVWGWGSALTGGASDPAAAEPGFYSQYVSYAYPAGMSLRALSEVVLPPVPK